MGNEMSFKVIEEFENEIAKFFGSPYAVAVDCCTHGVELCLRYTNVRSISVPNHTYISIPFLAIKLGIELEWRDKNWNNFYYVTSVHASPADDNRCCCIMGKK